MKFKLFSLKRWRVGALALCLLQGAGLAAEAADEKALRIEYLAKFPKFVDWPAAVMTPGSGELHFCVMGDEDINSIAAAFRELTIQGRVVTVQDAKRMNPLKDCHVLYVADSETWRIRSILAEIESLPILSISGAENFAREGGLVGLVKQDNRLKFDINLTMAKRIGLGINAQFAKLAIHIY